MERTEKGYRLSNGREFSAWEGIVGLGPDLDQVYDGYDGHIVRAPDEWLESSEQSEDARWTAEEKVELADFMIGQWQAFRVKALE